MKEHSGFSGWLSVKFVLGLLLSGKNHRDIYNMLNNKLLSQHSKERAYHTKHFDYQHPRYVYRIAMFWDRHYNG